MALKFLKLNAILQNEVGQ